MMTKSINHDHNVICPVVTAGFCTWIMHVSTGKFGHSSEMLQERGERSCLVLSGSAESQSQQSQDTQIFPQQGGREDKRGEKGGERTERRKEAELWVRENSSVKGLAIHSPSIPLCCPRRCSLTAQDLPMAGKLHTDFSRGYKVFWS